MPGPACADPDNAKNDLLMNSPRPTTVALYLAQYHPIPENDEWWGKGFTEWTNVAKAQPLFPGHQQPNLPADLGFYDLRVPETRQAQADMARAYGVDAFCYYHYWFGNGRRLLQRPFDDVLASGQPELPFMLCWANQTWSGIWHGLESKTLIEQTYPGPDDHRKHFECLLPAFRDPRYLRVNGCPVFMVFRPLELPDTRATLDLWRAMARAAGLPGMHFLAQHWDPMWDPRPHGYDAFVNASAFKRRRSWVPWSQPLTKLKNKLMDLRRRPTVVSYADLIDHLVPDTASDLAIPCVLPNWDNTPRSSWKGLVMQGSTPELFGRQLDKALKRCAQSPAPDKLLFIKSWNEWAEGNHLEPGRQHGHGYLEVLKSRLGGATAQTASPDGP